MSKNPAERDCGLSDLDVSSESRIATVRLDLKLEPLENGYAEFNYGELISASYKSVKVDLEEEEEALPSRSTSSTSSKRPNNVSFQAKLFGYDTSDSFIDDSELFDECTPPTPGGFYINLKVSECQSPNVDVCSSTTPGETIVVDVLKNSNTKENKVEKRKTLHSSSKNVKQSRAKRTNTRNEIEIIGEVIRRPFSVHVNQNRKYEPKSTDIKCSTKAEGSSPKLPSFLPEILMTSINLLKESAIMSKANNLGVFNEHSKKLFIDFELQLLPFNIKVRSDIYSYLSSYFSLSAATLKKKSKMLIIQQLMDEIDNAILLLANEILRANIPALRQQNVDDAVCQSKVFSPMEKHLLLSIFRLKKKLFDVQRAKTKDFRVQLANFLREDIVHMWLPSQMNVESLLDLANEFYTIECAQQNSSNLSRRRPSHTSMSVEKPS